MQVRMPGMRDEPADQDAECNYEKLGEAQPRDDYAGDQPREDTDCLWVSHLALLSPHRYPPTFVRVVLKLDVDGLDAQTGELLDAVANL